MALNALPVPRTPDSMDAPPLRWGILGTGWIADRFVGSLQRHTRQVVAAVGSRTRGSAEAAADRWGGVAAHPSYEALVADPSVEVVYVATPHNFHLPHALLAIAAGKHVLIEKPVGLSAQEARTIHAAAQAAGLFCMEAMWTLFLPKFDVVAQLLADRALGEVRSVFADMGELFDANHRIMRADLAGGPLLDLGTYPATLTTWVLGAPSSVHALGTPAPGGVNGDLAVHLRTDSGALGGFHVTILSDTPSTAWIGGTTASVHVDRPFYRPGRFVLRQRIGPDLVWDEPRIDHEGLHFEAAEVARCIVAGRLASPIRPFEDTIATLDLMDRVRAETGLDFTAALDARASTGSTSAPEKWAVHPRTVVG